MLSLTKSASGGKKIIRLIPAILWMSFIYYLSSRSTIGIGQTKSERFLILKTFHLIEYSVLYALIFFAVNRPRPSAVISYFYALSDEFHQSLIPGRDGKFVDTLIDLIGIVIGIMLVKKLIKITFIKKYL